jgi:TolB-like protein
MILLYLPLFAQPRMTIAILTLKNAAEVTKGEAEIISDRIRVEIFKTGNVDVMEREQMQTVLKEQGFQASGACTDEGCLVEMGQILGVQQLISGSIGKLGKLYLVNARVIDVRSGKILKVVSEDIDGGIEGVVGRIPGIAWRLVCAEQDTRKPVLAEPSPERKREEQKPDPKNDETPKNAPDCKDKVFLEAVNFDGMLPFKVLTQTYEEINSDLKDAIEEAVDDEIDDDIDVEIITASQIGQLPANCKSGLVKAIMESYSTRKSGTQNIGKAKVAFYFFDTPFTKTATFKITIEEEGDRHWEDQQPLMNALEAVAGELEEKLADADLIDHLDPNKK